MYPRLLGPPSNKSFFLFGPRGTGKTTWVRSVFPDAVCVDLLEAELLNDLTANPQRLGNLIPPGHRGWIVIDEVQRVPELLHEVHRLIEAKRFRFALTASSPRKLKHAGPDLLAGRALTLSLHPLTAAEAGDDFRLDRALRFGQLPSVHAAEEVEGVAIESLFPQETVALNEALDLGYQVHFWLDSTGREVDVVLYGPKGLLAFEVRRTARVTRELLSGLRAFLRDYPMAKAFYVYGGARETFDDGIRCLPAETAIKTLGAILSSPLSG